MKWVEIAAVKGKDISKAVDKFEKRIVARWGALATVMADNAFKGKFVESSFSWPVITTPPDKDHETICNKKVD